MVIEEKKHKMVNLKSPSNALRLLKIYLENVYFFYKFVELPNMTKKWS